MRNILCAFIATLCLLPWRGEACTSIIISGKATPDGRPLMWKHRDTGAANNHIVYFDEGGYRFLGLVNSSKKGSRAVWNGTNETGFSIMNTASYNLKDDNVKGMGREGTVMRMALTVCKTVDDFAHFLDTLSRPMRVEANFGVIDAYGGAAYFETNNTRYYKKDVNDPNVAPDGYLIYTNFSREGREDEGKGYIRYETARKLFQEMRADGFTPHHILQRVSRSFYHSLLGIDLKDAAQSPNNHTGWVVDQDFIPRVNSTAAIVVQGVKPGMNPELTTMWTVLGYPPTSVAIPLWVKMGAKQPAWVLYDESRATAPLNAYADRLEKNARPIQRGNGQQYLYWQALWNDEGTGYMQRLQPVEDEIFALFDAHKTEWERTDALDTETITQLYERMDTILDKAFRELTTSSL